MRWTIRLLIASVLTVFFALTFAGNAHAQTTSKALSERNVSQQGRWGFVPSKTPPGASTAVLKAARLSAAQRKFRGCVTQRESGGRVNARNPHSSAQGTYQFLDRQWRHGLSFMVKAELRKTGEYRKGLRKQLSRTQIADWPSRYQDVAFAAVLNARGKWSGWGHWYLAGSKCNNLAGRK